MTDLEHGVAAFRKFEDSTAEDWKILRTQRPRVQRAVPARVVEQLSYLGGDAHGYPVDRLEHSLQTATRAERDGRDNEYVLCALLHDIGDVLSPMNHPSVGAAILKPFVSEANHWMVLNHDVFQGYYFWHHVGGDRNAREAFRDSAYFDYTAEFCARYDQLSFDPDYHSAPLSYFEPLIQEYLVDARRAWPSGRTN